MKEATMKSFANIVAACGLAAALGLMLAPQASAQGSYYYYRGGYPHHWSYPAGPVARGYAWSGYAHYGDEAYAYAPRDWSSGRDRSTFSPASPNYAPSLDR
jgi:hypothetical protein